MTGSLLTLLNAQSLATSYADKNGGGLAPSDITISSTKGPNDTIAVKIHRGAPGFFSKLCFITSQRKCNTPSAGLRRSGPTFATRRIKG